MKRFALILVLAVACSPALAQQRPDKAGKNQGTSRDDRERMREDMRDAYRQRQERPDRQQQKWRQMSPEERDKLRRDIEDANRGLKR